jgi:hypothetical protein
MNEELTNKFTPCVPSQMLYALAYAWEKLFNETPAKESLYILLSQWAHETGRGKYCHNWNIGNYKHIEGDSRDYCYFTCKEIINGKEVWYHPDVDSERPYCCFRAYRTIEAGAIDYLASLYNRYKKAWPAVLAGDPSDFAHQLKLQKYYSDAENDRIDPDTGEVIHGYKWSICSLFKEFSKLDFNPEHEYDLDDQERANVLALVALTSYEITGNQEPEPENIA